MTISPLTIYFWGIADSAKAAFVAAGILTTAFGIIAVLISRDNDCCEDTRTWLRKFRFMPLFGIMIFWMGVLIPSSKTIAAMVILPKIANSEALRRDVPELYDMAVRSLKETLKPKTEVEKK